MRRYSMALAALAALVVVFRGAPVTAGAAAPISIRLGTVAPVGTSYERILKEMGEKWRKGTDGQVVLTIFAGGTQGSEAATVKRMASGQLQAALLTAGGLSAIDPATASLQDIPMLFNSLAEEEYVREQLKPELEKRLLAKGFVALFWGDSGWVRFFSRNAAVRPADLKSQKIFVTAAGSDKEMEIMQAFGYKPVALDLTDVLLQLQTRGVDAVPAPPVIANAGQFYRFTKHMTEVNWAPLVGAAVVTTRAWDALTPAMREVLMATAVDAGAQIQVESRRESDAAVESMKKKWQLEVHAVSRDVEAEWRTLAESAYPKIRGSMVPEEMFDRAIKLVADYRATHKGGR